MNQFKQQLEAAIVVNRIQPTWFDVVLNQGNDLPVRLGTFFDEDVAERHRRAVIDGVLFAHQRVAA